MCMKYCLLNKNQCSTFMRCRSFLRDVYRGMCIYRRVTSFLIIYGGRVLTALFRQLLLGHVDIISNQWTIYHIPAKNSYYVSVAQGDKGLKNSGPHSIIYCSHIPERWKYVRILICDGLLAKCIINYRASSLTTTTNVVQTDRIISLLRIRVEYKRPSAKVISYSCPADVRTSA